MAQKVRFGPRLASRLRFERALRSSGPAHAMTTRSGAAPAASLFGTVPDGSGAPGEARLLTRISPDVAAARTWADLAQNLGARARHARAVNLDPAALILDTLFRIEAAARRTVA